MLSRGDRAQRLAIFLVVVGLNNIPRNRARRLTAMLAAFLNQDRNHDFRISFGCVSDEPGVVFKFLLLCEAIPCVVADDLRGSRLPAEFDSCELQLRSRATALIHDAVHCVGDFFNR